VKDQICTSRKAAELLGVTPRTVQLWADAGILDGWKTPGGHRRFSTASVMKLADDIVNGHHGTNDTPISSARPRGTEPVRILVVEDDKTLTRLYDLTLNSWGLPVEVILANDGYQGLIEVGRFNPELLILDMQMPNIDGFSVIEALKKQKLLKDMHLMIITALTEREVKEKVSLGPDVTFIQKPIPFLKVRAKVESILLKRS